MPANIDMKTIKTWTVVTDSGNVMFGTARSREVIEFPDGRIEGKTEESKKTIQELDLNSRNEIRHRQIRNQLRAISAGVRDEKEKKIVAAFSHNIANIAELNRNAGSSLARPHCRNLLYRMLYANAITALETFLSDYLINSAEKNGSVVLAILKNDPELKNQKKTLAEHFSDPDLPRRRALERLAEITFHNMTVAKSLYESAFPIPFPSCNQIGPLIEVRHDIVHRNGEKKNVQGSSSDQLHKINNKDVFHAVNGVCDFVLDLLQLLCPVQIQGN